MQEYYQPMSLPPAIINLCRELKSHQGLALIVGGAVRDHLLKIMPKDFDMEVYGIPYDTILPLIKKFGNINTVGKSFGVIKLDFYKKFHPNLTIDLALPRKDNKINSGHTGFESQIDPFLDFHQASSRRDLTINAMAYNPLTEKIMDAHGGFQDLKNKILRAVDPLHFSEDPLRALRVAQFSARFNMQVEPDTISLCSKLKLQELPAERIYQEFKKLFIKGINPSRGFDFLHKSKLLPISGIENNQKWKAITHQMDKLAEHIHGKPNIDFTQLTKYSLSSSEVLILMFSLIKIDTGPLNFLGEGLPIIPPQKIKSAILHLQLFLKELSSTKEWDPQFLRSSVRKAQLKQLGVPVLLIYLALCDMILAKRFLKYINQLDLPNGALPALVQGRHLKDLGIIPGKIYSEILAACLELQDRHGATQAEDILSRLKLERPQLFPK